MKLGLRARLVFLSLGLIATSLLCAGAFLVRAFAQEERTRARRELEVLLALLAPQAAASDLDLGDVARWDALADELGRRTRARVTFFRRDGAVVGDSEVPTDRIASIDDPQARPEVAAALNGQLGAAERRSATTQVPTLYVAAPMTRDGELFGVARVARPLDAVEAMVTRVRETLLFAGVLALAVAGLVASAATHRLASSVAGLENAARRMAEGDLDARTRVEGSDEVASLGRALDRLASNLTATVRELRGERDLTGGILRSMEEGVLVLDGEGRIALVNPALREMLLLGGEVIGRSPIEAIRHAELKELLEKARRTGRTELAELELGSGLRPRRALVRAAPLGETPGGLLVVFVDVTELRRLEAVRRDFVANVSHELRTPVTAIRSAAETLRSAVTADPQAALEFVDIVNRNAERLQALVEDVLDLSRIESREFRLQVEPVELGPFCTHVAAMFRERAEKKGVRVVVEPATLAVRADRRALEQILSNLLDNAIKYCPAGTTVRLAAQEESDGVRMSVSDDGPGIEARHLPRLFERFYRVDAGRSRAEGGTGLGLSIVKHLVEAMGGEVGVASQPGRGTTFFFSLPRAA